MKKAKIKLDDMERRILVKLHKTGSNATDQCWGGIDLLCFGGQLLHIDLAAGIPLEEHTDHIGTVFTDSRHCIQIDSSRQHTATLMVGVVTAYFGASGSGEITRRAPLKSSEAGIQRCLSPEVPESMREWTSGFPPHK